MLRGSMPEKPFLNCNYTRKIFFPSFSDSAKMKILDIWFATCLAFLYVTMNLKVLRHSCVCAIGITSSDIEISIIAIARKGSINRRLIQQDQRKCNLSIGLQMLFLELPSLRHVSFIYIGIGNQNCYYQSFYWDPFSLPLPSPFSGSGTACPLFDDILFFFFFSKRVGEASRRISTVWSQVCRRNRKHVVRRLGLGCITRQEGGLQAKEELGSRLNRASPSFQRPATLPSLHYIDSSFLCVFLYATVLRLGVSKSTFRNEMKTKSARMQRGRRGQPPLFYLRVSSSSKKMFQAQQTRERVIRPL